MKRILIACPKGVQTGGPEALHQLANAFRKFHKNTYLWDPDISRIQNKPVADYSHYGELWLETEPSQQDIVVLPEILSELIPRFYGKNVVCFWWLSVNNFKQSNSIPIEVLHDLYPKVIHLYQSEYANNYLIENKLNNKLNLGDYINNNFSSENNLTKIKSNPKTIDDLVIAINPSKGLERTEFLLKKLNKSRIIRLENMSRSQVIESLLNSNIYIDLGDHPGMDRIPREAALLDCIVLTNFRGSASNDIDIPIDETQFKFNDYLVGFEDEILKKLEEISQYFDKFLEMQESYRAVIKSQKNKFINDVEHLYSYIENYEAQEEDNNFTSIRSFVEQLILKNSESKIDLINFHSQRNDLVKNNEELRNEINRIINSKTWKIAKSITKLKSILKQL